LRGTAFILLPKQGLINDYEEKELEPIENSHKKAESITDFSSIVALALSESKKKSDFMKKSKEILENKKSTIKNPLI